MQTQHASDYANDLLAQLGLCQTVNVLSDSPETAFARSGLSHLSAPCPAPIASGANGTMLALKRLANNPERLPENGAVLLGERARLLGLKAQERISASKSCRLLDCQDGRLALNMARDEDWELMPAWLEAPAGTWDEVEAVLATHTAKDIVHRGQAMGLAVGLDALSPMSSMAFKTQSFQRGETTYSPLVVDLSSLWAGPLCASLLGMMGARVVKVESTARPDGARRGNADFYRLLNADKESRVFDFTKPEELKGLKQLIDDADVVIEASRPRALKQLGIIAEEMMVAKPGKVWLSLTAYGRGVNAIGFGDDIGVAAGLVTVMELEYGEPSFVGDAIADPLSGLHGALTTWALWQQGGGKLIDLSMRDVVRHAMGNDFAYAKPAGTSDLYPMRAVP